ncbi:hypothetical protein A2U01_0098780 [Trifolium medium]|nr:hypothetical protein [Trifolium medium]
MACCAVMLRKFGKASVVCASCRKGWRIAPVSWIVALGRFGQWRVAQLHLARRALMT